MYKLGIDVGGTNTDAVLIDENLNVIASVKQHTSENIYDGILDAVRAVSLPTVEVHISDVNAREEFRRVSYIRAACVATIAGHGTNGYLEAIDLLLEGATV